MSILNFTGFETGDTSEFAAVGVGASIQSTTKKNGTYALRCNPSAASTHWARITGTSSTGKAAGFAIAPGSTAYCGFWFRIDSGSSNQIIASWRTSTDAEVLSLYFTGGGLDLGYAGAPVGGTQSISYNTWYFVEWLCAPNSTSQFRINGGGYSSYFGTPNLTIDRLQLGHSASSTFDCYYDDLYINNTGHLGGAQVTVAVPTGNSATNTAWSASAGNKWACVDELPPSAADYIESLTTAGDRRYSATHASAATLGVTGAIKAVKSVAIFWEPTSTTTLGAIGIRSGSTNFELTPVDIGTTAEVTMFRLDDTDPNTGAAWTTTNLDAAEPLVRRSTSDTSNIRVKWMGLMILTSPVEHAAKFNVSGTATVAAAATVSPAGATHTAAIALTANGLIASLAAIARSAASALPASATLALVGTATYKGTVAITGAASLAPLGTATWQGVTALTGTGSLSPLGVGVFVGQAALPSAATLAPTGTSVAATAAVALTATGALSPTGLLTAAGRAALAGSATIAPVSTRETFATAAFTATGAFAGVAFVTLKGATALAGSAALSPLAALNRKGAAALAGAATLAPLGRRDVALAAALAGTGALSPAPITESLSFAQLDGTALLALAAVKETVAQATLSGSAMLSALAIIKMLKRVRLDGGYAVATRMDGSSVTALRRAGGYVVAPRSPGGSVTNPRSSGGTVTRHGTMTSGYTS